jgi:hypothetical protein
MNFCFQSVDHCGHTAHLLSSGTVFIGSVLGTSAQSPIKNYMNASQQLSAIGRQDLKKSFSVSSEKIEKSIAASGTG